MPKRHDEDQDAAIDAWGENDEPTFERLRRQPGKAPTIKGDRRQQSKEFGRAMFKYHKERRKGGSGKP